MVDNETLRYFYMYNMFRANCNHCFFVFRHFGRVGGKLTSCIGIALPVRVSEGYIIKILMNLYNALEACIVGCYLEGLQK